MVGAGIANITALQMELKMERKKLDLMSRGLTPEMLANMDLNGNGIDRDSTSRRLRLKPLLAQGAERFSVGESGHNALNCAT